MVSSLVRIGLQALSVFLAVSLCITTIKSIYFFNDFCIDVRVVRKVFQPNDNFSIFSGNKSSEAWSSMRPAGGGFLEINKRHQRQLRLAPGIQQPYGADHYGVSVFHQLHCLEMIRNNYYNLLTGELQSTTRDQLLQLDYNSSEAYLHKHIDHCFDYVRQSLMCAGDVTIEPAQDAFKGVHRAINGWNVEHRKCRDWSQILEWAKKHKASIRR
ncbi:hypothetical protein BT63DRAFT_460952 [Microthyrium microscopicum]|uniref:Uncharacterized protein n=1 Tax=Microthyrium microscopicum TaxID=703497 RepID=A0A6A6TVR2_9PEZI|nr:hypothetical protein BT63DRAFT_460952 [Microthyrium microscopicum]